MQSIAQAAAALNGGAKSRSLIEECLARIGNKAGEGERAFLKVHAEAALAAADFHDRMRSNGTALVVGLASFPNSPMVTVPAAIYIIMQHLLANVVKLRLEANGSRTRPPLVNLTRDMDSLWREPSPRPRRDRRCRRRSAQRHLRVR